MRQLSNFSQQAYQNVLFKNGSGETYAFEFKARNILGRKPAETSKVMVDRFKLQMTPEEFQASVGMPEKLLDPGDVRSQAGWPIVFGRSGVCVSCFPRLT